MFKRTLSLLGLCLLLVGFTVTTPNTHTEDTEVYPVVPPFSSGGGSGGGSSGSSGDITSVVAGEGLSGGAANGAATIDVVVNPPIEISGDKVSCSTCETTTGAQTKVDTHSADTTNVHGITDTANLETTTGAQSKVDTHAADTTDVHGIANTANIGDITGVTAGAGLGGGALSGNAPIRMLDPRLDGSAHFAADAGSTDAYASCPASLSNMTVPAYVDGSIHSFRPNTVNTGPATWNGCTLGDVPLVKVTAAGVSVALEDGDLKPDQNVIIQYHAANANFQVISNIANPAPPPGSDKQCLFNDGGIVGADGGCEYDKTTDQLSLAGGIDTCLADPTKCLSYNGSALTTTRQRDLLDVDGAEAVTTGSKVDGNLTKFNAAGQIVDSGIAASGVGGSITVAEADANPSVGSVNTIKFDQADGFTVTDNADGSVTVGHSGGSSGGGDVIFLGDFGGNIAGDASTYLMPSVNGAQGNETWAPPVARAGNVTAMQFKVDGGVPTGQSVVITVRKNGVDTAVTCTIPSEGTSCSDTAHSVAFAQFDEIAVEFTVSGASALGATFGSLSFE